MGLVRGEGMGGWEGAFCSGRWRMEGVWREQAMLLLGLSLGLREPKSRRNDGEDCCEEDERKLDLKAAEAEEAAAMLDDTMGKSLLR